MRGLRKSSNGITQLSYWMVNGEVVVIEITCPRHCQDHFVKTNPEQFDITDQVYISIGIDFIPVARIVPTLPCAFLSFSEIEF